MLFRLPGVRGDSACARRVKAYRILDTLDAEYNYITGTFGPRGYMVDEFVRFRVMVMARSKGR